jgi:hypothetical protein
MIEHDLSETRCHGEIMDLVQKRYILGVIPVPLVVNVIVAEYSVFLYLQRIR